MVCEMNYTMVSTEDSQSDNGSHNGNPSDLKIDIEPDSSAPNDHNANLLGKSTNGQINILPLTSQDLGDHENECTIIDNKTIKRRSSSENEMCKIFLSFLYCILGGFLDAFAVAVAHDRVPDMRTYKPLPDIFLDNLPYVPWSFRASEIIIIILSSMGLLMLLFHKYRCVIFRRYLIIAGSMFMIRSVCLCLTAMPVSGAHHFKECTAKSPGDFVSRLKLALNVFLGSGLYVNGVRTCGDYMFSGHTAQLTLLTFFINEYTATSKLFFVPLITWSMNLSGMGFILFAHEHYSIDVFLGFVISWRLFTVYHALAASKTLQQREGKRTRRWFPIVSYFEAKSVGNIPNEFEWPFPSLYAIKCYITSKTHVI